MREIKFRAWDTHLNKMLYPAKGIEFCFCDNFEGISMPSKDGINNDYLTGSRFELMQYTGLKDKNGKDIYEGDIILTQEYETKPYSDNKKKKRFIGIVKYCISSGNGFYNKDTGRWNKHIQYGAKWVVSIIDKHKKEREDKYRYGNWGDFFDCEVVGNIHANPELLKETK